MLLSTREREIKMIKVYGDIISGNCYKIYLLMNLLDLDYQWIPIDIMRGEAATEAFIKKNPNAKIPLLETAEKFTLAESNAILNYLAEGSTYIPEDKFLRAKVLEWQFFEQYSHEPYIAVARFINKYQGLPKERIDEYRAKQTGGHKALKIMQRHLAQSNYLVGDQFSIADISLYAYTHVADEGGFDLSQYPAITEWIKRIEALPRYVPMELKAEDLESTANH